jgi:hypothetical protein
MAIVMKKWLAFLWISIFLAGCSGYTDLSYDKNGRMITGDALVLVWQALNKNIKPIFTSENFTYMAWLEIPEIGLPYSGFGCP